MKLTWTGWLWLQFAIPSLSAVMATALAAIPLALLWPPMTLGRTAGRSGQSKVESFTANPTNMRSKDLAVGALKASSSIWRRNVSSDLLMTRRMLSSSLRTTSTKAEHHRATP